MLWGMFTRIRCSRLYTCNSSCCIPLSSLYFSSFIGQWKISANSTTLTRKEPSLLMSRSKWDLRAFCRSIQMWMYQPKANWCHNIMRYIRRIHTHTPLQLAGSNNNKKTHILLFYSCCFFLVHSLEIHFTNHNELETHEQQLEPSKQPTKHNNMII